MARPFGVFLAVLCIAFAGGAGAAEEAVDLELVLAVDVSGSMDEDEHALQRQGYVAAFRHPQVINAIRSGFLGRIAVTYVEWAGPASQVISVPWRIIDGGAGAAEFAADLAAQPRAFIRGTSISGGLEFPPASSTPTALRERGASSTFRETAPTRTARRSRWRGTRSWPGASSSTGCLCF